MTFSDKTRLRVSASNLAADAVAREVSTALSDAGLAHILLKGPSTARWLYEKGTRIYGDVDVLVDVRQLDRARDVLTSRGFLPHEKKAAPFLDTPHAHAWLRGPGEAVDLHYRVPGSGKPPEEQWTTLAGHTEKLEVAGHPIDVLRPPARALHLALHVAQHGLGVEKPMEDLRRLLEKEPTIEFWSEVVQLSQELEANESLSAALRLTTQGTALAEALGLAHPHEPEVVIRTTLRDHGPALGLQRIGDERTLKRKTAVAWKTLFPPPPYMRYQYSFARKGAVGLAAAYAIRPFVLLYRLIHGIPAVRRVRRNR